MVKNAGLGEMAQQLGALAALVQSQSSVSSILLTWLTTT